MGWIWSDDLATTLESSTELAPLIPAGWTARPCAFALGRDEDARTLGRRLLGLPAGPATEAERGSDEPKCHCGSGR